HFALEAWRRSTASRTGRLLIAGEFLPDYERRLAGLLDQPGVKQLGHRDDVPELMRSADVLVLPSIEEGSALVCNEALASGCVLLVSDAAGAACTDGVDGLVHRAGDVDRLTAQLTELDRDRALLARLREAGLQTAKTQTWEHAGERLLGVYE